MEKNIRDNVELTLGLLDELKSVPPNDNLASAIHSRISAGGVTSKHRIDRMPPWSIAASVLLVVFNVYFVSDRLKTVNNTSRQHGLIEHYNLSAPTTETYLTNIK